MLDKTVADGLSYWFPALDQGCGKYLRDAGEFARPEVDLLIDLARTTASGAILDVGANIGAVALPLARACPGRQIIAFEANAGLHRLLSANIIENRILTVDARHAAVGENGGVAKFPKAVLSEQRNYGALAIDNQEPTEPVLMVTLDEIAPATTLIKIDVEGAEPAVLRGAATLIQRDQPIIFFEATSNAALNASYLMERGYRLAWFMAPLITPSNPKRFPLRQSEARGDINLLAMPVGKEAPWSLPLLRSPDENWRSRVGEMSYMGRYGFQT